MRGREIPNPDTPRNGGGEFHDVQRTPLAPRAAGGADPTSVNLSDDQKALLAIALGVPYHQERTDDPGRVLLVTDYPVAVEWVNGRIVVFVGGNVAIPEHRQPRTKPQGEQFSGKTASKVRE
jgi:hypothetical protein